MLSCKFVMGDIWITLIKYINHGNQKWEKKFHLNSLRNGLWLNNGSLSLSLSLLLILVLHKLFLLLFTFLSWHSHIPIRTFWYTASPFLLFTHCVYFSWYSLRAFVQGFKVFIISIGFAPRILFP